MGLRACLKTLESQGHWCGVGWTVVRIPPLFGWSSDQRDGSRWVGHGCHMRFRRRAWRLSRWGSCGRKPRPRCYTGK